MRMNISTKSCRIASAFLLTLTITATLILAATPQDLMAVTPEGAVQATYSPEQTIPDGAAASGNPGNVSASASADATAAASIPAASIPTPKANPGLVTSLEADTTPPTISNLTPADGTVTGPSVFLSASYSDPEPSSGIRQTTAMIHVDNRHQVGTTITGSGISILKSGLTTGSHKIEAFICDNLYNCSVSTWHITVDATAPTASGMQPTGNINTATSTISAILSDGSGSGVNAGGVSVALDGVDVSPGCSITASSLSCGTGALTVGDHSVSIDIPDNVGNHGAAAWSFHVDPASIGVTGQQPAPSSWQTTATQQIGADFQAAGTGIISAATVQLLVDGADVTSAATIDASGVRYTPGPFSEGNHTVRLTAGDDAGHNGQSEWDFNVDTIAPEISGEAPRGSTDSSGMPSISSLYADDGSGIDTASVRVNLNGDDVTSSATVGAGDVSYTPGSRLPSGINNIQVSVADNSGNSRTSAWSINVPAPQQPTGTPTPGQSSGTISLVRYWQSYSPMSTSGSGWSVTGFTASPNSYFMPWYDSSKDDSGHRSELVISNRGGGEASVSVFVGGQEKWHGTIAEAGEDIRQLAGTTGGPVKIVCPTGQLLEVKLRTTRGPSVSEVLAVAGEDLEPVWLLPWYAPRTGDNPGANSLYIGNTGTEEAAVNVYLGDPDLPESLKGQYSIQAGTTAVAELDASESGLVRVVSTNGQPLIVGEQTTTSGSFSALVAAGLSRLDSRYSFDNYDSRAAGDVQGDWLLLGNGMDDEARVEISIGGRKMNDPENPDNDFFILPKGGAREIQFPETTGSPVEVVCTNCSFGQGIVAAHRVIKNQSISEAMGRPSPLMPYGDLQ
ncbi:MAG: hypothetical protein WC911_09375 [Thermoleophilia bacterium]